jgi:hypothetical protein
MNFIHLAQGYWVNSSPESMKNIFIKRINFHLDLGALIIKLIPINRLLRVVKACKNTVLVVRILLENIFQVIN